MKYDNDPLHRTFRLLTASGAILLLVSLFYAKEAVWKPCRQAFASRGWVAVPAETVSGPGPAVTYQYRYGGKRYGSGRRDFFGGGSIGDPAGEKITCRVDPEHPWEAVLDSSVPWKYYAHLAAAAVLFAAGAALIASACRQRFGRKSGGG